MNKKDLIKRALWYQDAYVVENAERYDMEFIAALIKEANYDDDIIDAIYDDIFYLVPDEFREMQPDEFNYSADDEKAAVIKYLKHINEKGE